MGQSLKITKTEIRFKINKNEEKSNYNFIYSTNSYTATL